MIILPREGVGLRYSCRTCSLRQRKPTPSPPILMDFYVNLIVDISHILW